MIRFKPCDEFLHARTPQPRHRLAYHAALLMCGAFFAEQAVFAQQYRTGARIGVVALYDDNLLRENDLRPIPNSADLRITPTLTLDLKRALGRHEVFVKGDAGYDFHRRNSQLDAERIEMTGGARIMLGARCRANVSAALDYRQTDVADLGDVESNRTRSRTYEVSVACPKVAGFHPVVTATRYIGDNTNDFRRSSDTRSYTLGGALIYSRPSLGDVGIFYSYSKFERPGIRDIIGFADETEVHRGGLRFDRNVAARLRGSLAVNAIIVEASLPTTRDYKGIGWEGELGWLPSPDKSVTLNVSRDVRGESSLGVSYIVLTSARVLASWRLGGKTWLGTRAVYVHRDLRGEDPRPGIGPRGSDKTREVALTLRYDLTDRMSMNGEIAHGRRNSRNDYYDYSSNRAAFRISYRF
jgi:hypothetical protein